jgi:D-3-phosphoglycerate dehydrogenase
MSRKEWLKKSLKRTELFGKTLGLIGAGRIAREVAKRASAFGMNIIAYDKYVDASDWVEMVSFDELLARSDFISLHVPLTPETVEMINSESIRKMKSGVIVINTGRGRCVSETDMAEALKSGHVRAYGTDVWYSDPPDWDNCPLPDTPNVFMTPHIGASTKENLLRIGDIVENIIRDFVEGRLK